MTHILLLPTGMALLFFPKFLEKNFGRVTIEQLLFFITTDDGMVGTDPHVVMSAVKLMIVRPLLFLAVFCLSACCYRKFRANASTWRAQLAMPWLKRVKARYTICFVVMCCAYSFVAIGGMDVFKRQSGPDLFSQQFVAPPEAVPARRPHNLILLYVESLENTFGDQAVFGQNLNEPLRHVFPRSPLAVMPSPGAAWTMAGMLSSQCGVPLASFIGNRWENGNSGMLRNMKCLGDYLAQNGYSQYFFAGHDIKFAGTDKFYKTHGYNEIWGKKEFRQSGVDQALFNGWGDGLHDDTLLNLAGDKIKALHGSGQKFNVTILTTDNHAPDGKESPRCPSSSISLQFARAVHCDNLFIEKFIKDISAAGILKDTVLVVMGDHPFMDNDSHKVYFSGNRSVFFNYVSPSGVRAAPSRHYLTHFDVFPSLLELTLGTRVDRIGLGWNLFSPTPKTYDRFAAEVTQDAVLSNSPSYKALWQ